MNILDLEESEGLTPALVRAYLERRGWTIQARHGVAELWQFDGHQLVMDPRNQNYLDMCICALAVAEIRTPQSLLREIVPRLRPWPSRVARAAHAGLWLVVCREDATACMGTFRNDVPWFQHSGEKCILTEEDAFALYWPVDENCQRVAWPKDAQGRPL